ncbi:aminopeptidase N [Arcanobacterium pluranimalium]|uniref:aminopeptidase N n=1 Tax=Arcanobacterium pluranimalium TaxID=108028 RepID=UPI001958E207|nr:aminopeptidase N [Arcanobacterium pluranimalium]MBM7825412.1 aminopeptidase N [Arcanobacterium pluranimalium]
MSENLSRTEAQLRSSSLVIDSYQIKLDVSEAPSATNTFRTSSRITLTQLNEGDVFVDFIGDSVQNVQIDGTERDFQYDGARITFGQLNQGKHTIEIHATGVYSTSGEGLHRFKDPLDGQTYLYTQFEPADARRVFANFEQPDLKATFDISICAPESWTVLSNGEEKSCESSPENSLGELCTTRHFSTTQRMSTYLTAFIAGPYVAFNDEAVLALQTIKLGFYCRATLAEHFDFEDISTVTKQGLNLFPQAYGVPYPWGKYDSVFVPEYNLGAMENPGCVTFNEAAYIHRGQSTRAQREGRANTILHEMSHMWFGDYTTPQWWDDLWLKESFAEFMGAWGCAQATQYTEAWQSFAGRRLAWALQNDQYPTTHPIVADVPDLEAADQVFDGITYAKGAAVLRQLVAWVGEEAFFAGARAYFAAHPFSNATLDDLLIALEESSGKDVRLWAQQWLQTAGVSTLTVERQEDGVMIRQEGIEPLTGEKITRPHRIRVSAWKAFENRLQRIGMADVEVTSETFIPWSKLGGDDADAILPNDESLTYAKIGFDSRSLAAFLSMDVDDDLSRSVINTALWQAVRDAVITPRQYLAYISTTPQLADSALLSQRTQTMLFAAKNFEPGCTRNDLLKELFALAHRQVSDYSDLKRDQTLIWMRTLAATGSLLPHTCEILKHQLNELEDQDLRWQILIALAAHSQVSLEDLDTELARSASASDEVAYRQAVASMPNTRLQTIDLLLNNANTLSNTHVQALVDGFTHSCHSDEARSAFPHYFDHIESIWQRYSQEIAERIIYGLYPAPDLDSGKSESDLADATAWLDKPGTPAALRKIILDCRDDYQRKLRAQARA